MPVFPLQYQEYKFMLVREVGCPVTAAHAIGRLFNKGAVNHPTFLTYTYGNFYTEIPTGIW
jgi:hypothetical protein